MKNPNGQAPGDDGAASVKGGTRPRPVNPPVPEVNFRSPEPRVAVW